MNTWLLSEARRTALNSNRQLSKSEKQTKTPSPEEEYSEQGSPRESILEKGVEETSLQDVTKLPKFFEGDLVYFKDGDKYLKGKIISENDNNTYNIKPVNSSMSELTINEEEILGKDQFERKGGKTKRNKKHVQRKTRRHKKTNKKHSKSKKQTKRRK